MFQSNGVAGVAWYTPEQYEKLRQVAEDSEDLHSSYLDWTLEAAAAAKRAGVTHKVMIDVDEWRAWCQARGRRLNSESRAVYSSEMLKQGRGIPL